MIQLITSEKKFEQKYSYKKCYNEIKEQKNKNKK